MSFDPRIRVLVVDDMMTMRKIIAKACKDIGFTDIVEAADGAIAWETIGNSVPSIGMVISDWNMPNCTGLDLLKRVRVDSRFSSLPFIMVTAEAEKKQVAEAVLCGVDTYIVKPFNSATLKEKLEQVYQKKMAAS